MKIDEVIGAKLTAGNKAVIISSYQLSESEIEMIKQIFPSLKETALEIEVDKDILAGLIIKVGSLAIDLSLKAKLKDYFSNLYENL